MGFLYFIALRHRFINQLTPPLVYKMFRSAVLLARQPAPKVVRPTTVPVSPFALFLQENAGHKALSGLEIAARGAAAGKLWHSLPKEKKVALALQALKAKPFRVHKYDPRTPPPFGRYVKKYWSKAPEGLSFYDKVGFLAERFNKTFVSANRKK
eukprot:GILI01000262.1.p1 GENE.GILI01000262.1~~GILI01000262.1.p1  ORF type:complete len:154 (-),score=36.91 GILI01000262.1:76-537(-)